jgi:hypothetical protein
VASNLDGINLIIFISKNGEKFPNNQKIFMFLSFPFFQKRYWAENNNNKILI